MALTNSNSTQTFIPEGDDVFNFALSFFALDDIVVTIESALGVVTTLEHNPDLAASGQFKITPTNGDTQQGAVITTHDSYTGGIVVISRVVDQTQEYDLKAGSKIDPTAINTAFDRAVAQSQQIKEEIGRKIGHPVTDPSGLNYEAPSVAERKNKVLGWDSAGSLSVQSLLTSDTISVNTGAGLILEENIISGRISGTSLEFDGTNGTRIKDDGVTTDKILDDAVTTGKILDKNVTLAKIQDIADQKILGNVSGTTGVSTQVPIVGSAGLLLDEDDLIGNSDTKGATQQSIKAYVGSALLTLSNPVLNYSEFKYEVASNVAGPTFAASGTLGETGLNVVPLTDMMTPTGATFATFSAVDSSITLPAGIYKVSAVTIVDVYNGEGARLSIQDSSTAYLLGLSQSYNSDDDHVEINLDGTFTLSTETAVYLKYFKRGTGTADWAEPVNDGEVEIYCTMTIWKLD